MRSSTETIVSTGESSPERNAEIRSVAERSQGSVIGTGGQLEQGLACVSTTRNIRHSFGRAFALQHDFGQAGIFVDGRWQAAADGGELAVIDPSMFLLPTLDE
jgi:hypothetical protein